MTPEEIFDEILNELDNDIERAIDFTTSKCEEPDVSSQMIYFHLGRISAYKLMQWDMQELRRKWRDKESESSQSLEDSKIIPNFENVPHPE